MTELFGGTQLKTLESAYHTEECAPSSCAGGGRHERRLGRTR